MTNTVEEVLSEVAERWKSSGPLTDMLRIIDDVWRSNLDRQEPALGDDAMSLGTLCWRNVMNRTVNHFAGREDGIVARGGQTLEVTFAGRILHVSKVPTQSRSWDPQTMDWDASEVRTDGARANSAVYLHRGGTLFEDVDDVLPARVVGDPRRLTHLHLVWQGLGDAQTRAFLGFPAAGPLPFSAVSLVHDGVQSDLSVAATSIDVAATQPTHDSLAEPALPLRRRAQQESTGSASGS